MVNRKGPCAGCLSKGIDPNEYPCNRCTRLQKPQTKYDVDGNTLRLPVDNYCPKKTMKELMMIDIPGLMGSIDRRRKK